MKSEEGDGPNRVPSLLFYIAMLVSMIAASWIHPLLALVPATILIGYFCYRTIERKASQQRHILDNALQRLEVQEAMATAYTEEGESTTQIGEFPTNCPDCRCSLHVKNVTWIDSQTLICKNCESIIKTITTHD